MINVDILVIGSGPGGAITAWEAKKNNRDVLLIESGSNYKLNSCEPFSTLEMEQKYKYGGLTPTFNRPRITYVEGFCSGGGSEINSGFYHRIPIELINEWRIKFNLQYFEEKELDKHYAEIEKEISVSNLPNSNLAAKASLKLKEGADKLSWSNMEVPRWYKYISEKQGIKQSMSETYLKWYCDSGGKLINNLKAHFLDKLKDIWKFTSVDLKTNEKIIIKAKNIFLCGGAISTPFLLRSSGIKNNIGNSLQMHPTIKVVAEFEEIINNKNMGVPVHQIKEFSPSISMGCSISSKPYLALAMLDNEKYSGKVNTDWEKMAVYYAMIKPEGIGNIRKLPFFNAPLVRFHLTEDDLRLLSSALKKLCKALLSAGAINIYPSIKNYGVIKNLSDLDSIPEQLSKTNSSLMTIHLFSSCPMGENKKLCATDSFGKVFGHNNLFINDGSLLPSAPGVNPQGSIMAIARRNIHHFLSLD